MMKTLIETWRKMWSRTPNTTPRDFPFGLVSLAGGTSEGHGSNMGAFRYAQVRGQNYLVGIHLVVTVCVCVCALLL